MPLKDQIKNFTRKLVENKPDADALADMVHHGKVTSIFFENDGIVPNHPKWPLIVHRASVRFRGGFDPATIIDTLHRTGGSVPGGTRFTILCTTIRKPTKYLVLRAAMPSWSLAASREGVSRFARATSLSCPRPTRVTSPWIMRRTPA